MIADTPNDCVNHLSTLLNKFEVNIFVRFGLLNLAAVVDDTGLRSTGPVRVGDIVIATSSAMTS